MLRQCRDADFCERLAVPTFLEIAALLAVADNRDFRLATLLDELRRDRGALHIRRPYRRFLAVVGQKHFIEGNFVPRLVSVDFFNIQNAVLCDNVLLAARLYNSYLGHKSPKYSLIIPQ